MLIKENYIKRSSIHTYRYSFCKLGRWNVLSSYDCWSDIYHNKTLVPLILPIKIIIGCGKRIKVKHEYFVLTCACLFWFDIVNIAVYIVKFCFSFNLPNDEGWNRSYNIHIFDIVFKIKDKKLSIVRMRFSLIGSNSSWSQ